MIESLREDAERIVAGITKREMPNGCEYEVKNPNVFLMGLKEPYELAKAYLSQPAAGAGFDAKGFVRKCVTESLDVSRCGVPVDSLVNRLTAELRAAMGATPPGKVLVDAALVAKVRHAVRTGQEGLYEGCYYLLREVAALLPAE